MFVRRMDLEAEDASEQFEADELDKPRHRPSGFLLVL